MKRFEELWYKLSILISLSVITISTIVFIAAAIKINIYGFGSDIFFRYIDVMFLSGFSFCFAFMIFVLAKIYKLRKEKL